MTRDEWTQLEYTSLRAEILSRDEAERAAIRFYIPAGAAIYTVPYLVGDKLQSQPGADIYLWCLCYSVASLLVLVMVLSLFWSARWNA